MIEWFCKQWRWIKSRRPVTRGRYERELELLRLSVNRSIDEERRQLRSMIEQWYYVISYSRDGRRIIRLEMQVDDELIYYFRDPYKRQRFFYEIAEGLVKQIERELTFPKEILSV